MKSCCFIPLLLSLCVPVFADTPLPGVQYSTDAVIAPSGAGTDFWMYEEATPGNLARADHSANLHDVLSGHAGAPGGNVELFPTSEWPVFADASAAGAFASVIPTTLVGTAGASAFVFRSLNGNDWFGGGSGYNTSFGAPTLATQWFNGFIDSVVGAMTDPMAAAGVSMFRATLFDEWRDAGGFASLSDANIGYVYENTSGEIQFGLEGFLDASPRFRQFLNDSGYAGFSEFVPDGIQYSEVVMLNDEAYYSFGNGTPSGVQLDDAPFNSYTADFAFTEQVPEPSAISVVILALVPAMLRRKRRELL